MNIKGEIKALKFIANNGTSSGFLKADGSIDLGSYLTQISANSLYLTKNINTLNPLNEFKITFGDGGFGNQGYFPSMYYKDTTLYISDENMVYVDSGHLNVSENIYVGGDIYANGSISSSLNIINSGGNLILNSETADLGDIEWRLKNIEKHRIFDAGVTGTLSYRANAGTSYPLIHSGNINNYAWTSGNCNPIEYVSITGNQTVNGIKTFTSNIVGNVTGNAGTSTILQTARLINGTLFNGSSDILTANWGTARTLSFTGDVTGSSSVNGSSNVPFAMTLTNSGVAAGTYNSVTVDVKGRVTSGTNSTFLTQDATGLINNGSNTRTNKFWFDYNWGGTGLGGSVINFSGLSSLYPTEIFGNYSDGSYLGFRTKNGDTNTWNPARKIWHDGNLTQTSINNWNTAVTNNHTHTNKSVLDSITNQHILNWDGAHAERHTHTNKTVLDGITSINIDSWNQKLSTIINANTNGNNVNWNTLTYPSTGLHIQPVHTGNHTGVTNHPGFNYGTVLTIPSTLTSTTFGHQIAFNYDGGISTRNTNNVDNTFSQGWKTYWHTDNFTQTNINNWNTAVGWGDHTAAGYTTTTYVHTNFIATPSGNSIDISGENLNDKKRTGFYKGVNLINAPEGNGGWWYLTVETHDNNMWVKQTITSYGSVNTPNLTYQRVCVNGVWVLWDKLLTTTNTDNLLTTVSVLDDFYGRNIISTKNNGTTTTQTIYGTPILDVRNLISWGNTATSGSETFIPLSSRAELNYKTTNIFHYGWGGDSWGTSLISKGWNGQYKAWSISGDANMDDVEREFYLRTSKSSDGTWMSPRKIWTDKHFNIANYNTAAIADGKYVSLTTSQTVGGDKTYSGRGIFTNAIGNDYYQLPIETRGNGSTVLPGIGFHQPGVYAASLLCSSGTMFEFRAYASANYASVKALSFVKSGGTATQILMANGSVKEQSTINPAAGTNIGVSGNTVSVIAAPIFSGSVTAASFLETSLAKYKTNIKRFEKSGLELINELDIVTYDKIDGPNNKIGIIIDNSPIEFSDENYSSVDLYKTIFIQSKAIQELSDKNNKLEEELHNLRELIMSKLT